MSEYEPHFVVGQHVVRGNGKEVHEVVAVIITGRTPTYDLRSIERKRTSVGVPEAKIKAAFKAVACCSACGTPESIAPHHVDYVRQHGVCVV